MATTKANSKKSPSTSLRPRNPQQNRPDDFASVAKRLECDDDKARFEAKLGKLAKAKPTKPASKK